MGSDSGLGTRCPGFTPYTAADENFTSGLVDLLADHDDALLAAYVEDETTVSYRRLRGKLAAQTGQALVHPVYFGLAAKGAGVEELISGIKELLPVAEGEADGAISGTVFKVERGHAREKIAYVRMCSGTVRVRDRLWFGRNEEEKVTAISVFDRGSAVQQASIAAGQIGTLWGLGDVRIAEEIGGSRKAQQHHFAPPTLETVVIPRRPADKGALHLALTQLAEQDALINMQQNDSRQEIFVSLYGEVQKEVIQATRADEFGLDVTFRGTTTICIGRPIRTGAAVEIIDQDPNPFLATVGLRVEPAEVDAGAQFRLQKSVHGTMPAEFFAAVEETVRETWREGFYGWQFTGCVVIMTHPGYWPRQSSAHGTFDKSMSSTTGDFRNLTRLVLMDTLKEAGTRVCKPIRRFHLEIPPADTFGPT